MMRRVEVQGEEFLFVLLRNVEEGVWMRVVVRIGGSVVASPLNPRLIGRYAEVISDLRNEGHELVVVVGGGLVAREFIKAAEELSLIHI